MDVHLRQENDGGEMTIENGLTEMSDGLETAAFLSLFGGNDDDGGLQGDEPRQWWANFDETETEKQYRSQTQNLLRSIPLNTANLQRIEDAVYSDLAWLVESVATNVEALATMPALNTVRIQAFVEVDGKVVPLSFIGKKDN